SPSRACPETPLDSIVPARRKPGLGEKKPYQPRHTTRLPDILICPRFLFRLLGSFIPDNLLEREDFREKNRPPVSGNGFGPAVISHGDIDGQQFVRNHSFDPTVEGR